MHCALTATGRRGACAIRHAVQPVRLVALVLVLCWQQPPFAHAAADCKVPCSGRKELSFADVPVVDAPTGAAAAPLFSANGCGTDAVRVETPESLVPCCVVHDACYSICGIDRSFCDKAFAKCLEQRCQLASTNAEDQRACMGSANMLSMGVNMFGCTAFLDAQKAHCSCEERAVHLERLGAVIQHLYKHEALRDAKTVAEVSAIVDRAKVKGHVVLYQILEKYNATLIHYIPPSTDKGRKQRSRDADL